MIDETAPRVLLIEDNPGDARYIQELLREAEGFSTRPARRNGGALAERAESEPDGDEEGVIVHEPRLDAGIERLEVEDIDVVLLDLNLPDSAGLETLSRTRRQAEATPIVVLTGVSDRVVGLDALREGADEYLVKDEINPGVLVRSIYHAIERKAHEREQRRYEMLIEESTDVNAILNTDGTIRYITPSVEGVLGYDAEALVGERALEYVHPDDRQTAIEELGGLVENPDERGAVEFRFEHANGSWVVLHARGRNLVDDPAIRGVVVYTRDITDRKEYERRLESQRERLAAINQLNEVIHGVAGAVIDKSTRTEITEIACRRLAESGSYAFAWVGEADTPSGNLVSRVTAGVDFESGEAPLTEAERDGDGPIEKALRNGEIRTIRDIHADPEYDHWRDTAESYGFASAASIPIRHEGTTYGVLNVYTERTDGFQQEERGVLEHLGELLGHAIAAAERKQALMSDSVVELDLEVPEMVTDAIGDRPEEPIAVQRVLSLAADEFLVYGMTTDAGIAALESLQEARQEWESLTVIDGGEEDDERIRFQVRLTEPPLLSAIAAAGGSIEHAVIESGDYRITVRLPQGSDVRTVIDAVQKRYPEADALARRQVSDPQDSMESFTDAWQEALTDRQRTAVEVAYYSEFFEWPRGSSGEEVAEALGVSSPTFHQHVRAAERKLFEALLEE